MRSTGKEIERLAGRGLPRYENRPSGREIGHGFCMGSAAVKQCEQAGENMLPVPNAHFPPIWPFLEERGIHGFEAVGYGNVFHGVLEKFAGKLQDRG